MHEPLERKLKNFEEVCRRNSIKLTHQRLEIYREIAEDPDHPSAEDLFKRLRARMPTISLDTVYRTLATFERIGIIMKVQLLDERGRFEANLDTHHHLVCARCQSVCDLYWPPFDDVEMPSEAEDWGVVNAARVELRGVCKMCLGRGAKEGG